MDMERKIEQRWAARFARPALSTTPERHGPKSQTEQAAEPVKAEEAAEKVQPAA
jgi:hypothetical protein